MSLLLVRKDMKERRKKKKIKISNQISQFKKINTDKTFVVNA